MGREEDITELAKLPGKAPSSSDPEFTGIIKCKLRPNLCPFITLLVLVDSCGVLSNVCIVRVVCQIQCLLFGH